MISKKITIAATCMKVEYDKSRNLNKHIQFIEEAAEENAKLLVFPECSLQGYTWAWDAEKCCYLDDEDQQRYFQEASEPIPGPPTKIIAQQAASHDMLIQIGMAEKVEKSGENILYNSVALIGPDGLLGVFRKIHMAQTPIFRKGDSFNVFNTSIGKIGPIICADLAYPESVRVLALKGAEIVTMSTAWGMMTRNIPKIDIQDSSWSFPGYFSGYKYDLLGRAAALENGVWFVISNQVGCSPPAEEKSFGHSRIIDPAGRVIAGIGYEEGIVTAKVDIKAGIDPNRFEGRRPECYNIICARHATRVRRLA